MNTGRGSRFLGEQQFKKVGFSFNMSDYIPIVRERGVYRLIQCCFFLHISYMSLCMLSKREKITYAYLFLMQLSRELQ